MTVTVEQVTAFLNSLVDQLTAALNSLGDTALVAKLAAFKTFLATGAATAITSVIAFFVNDFLSYGSTIFLQILPKLLALVSPALAA